MDRQWARTGTRPRQPKDQRYQSTYLFGAICPRHGTAWNRLIDQPWKIMSIGHRPWAHEF